MGTGYEYLDGAVLAFTVSWSWLDLRGCWCQELLTTLPTAAIAREAVVYDDVGTVRYVEANPLRARMVARAQDY